MKTQAASLKSSMQSAAANPSNTSLAQVRTDVQGVVSGVRDVGNALSGTCE